jgi:hypothetical protein
MLRAHWVAKVALDDQLEKMARDDDFEISSFANNPDLIDTAFGTGGFFKQAKRDCWKDLNAYTHSGLRQLNSRFAGSRVQAAYGAAEIEDGLKVATASVLMLGYLLAKLTGREEAALELEESFDFGGHCTGPESDTTGQG